MSKRMLMIVAILVLTTVMVTTVAASQPTTFEGGWWGNIQVDLDEETVSFDFLVPDIGLIGTGTQPLVTPGRTAHGTFVGEVDGNLGECDYSVVTSTLPNGTPTPGFRGIFKHCTGGLEGLHLIGIGSGEYFGPLEGSYHFDP